MWLFTKIGFFSVVLNHFDNKEVLVRARCKNDIFNFYDNFHRRYQVGVPTCDDDRDYRWRVFVKRSDWLKIASEFAEEVDYTNFKDTVHELPDQQNKEDAYFEVWLTMHKVQRREELQSERRPPAHRIR